MANRNVNKGREAENAVAAVFRANGMPHAERRAKRGGMAVIDCPDCAPRFTGSCPRCDSSGWLQVPADAGDLTGIPGVVVQVKWSAYKPLAEDMRRTEEQRRVVDAGVGLLVRKRKGVGVARAGEWDAYLPHWQLVQLVDGALGASDPHAVWQTDLATAARLIAAAGYGDPETMRAAREVASC